MKEIQLNGGLVAVIDDEDYALVSKFKWFAKIFGHTTYARGNIRVNGRRMVQHMHRIILNAPHGVPVDHVDGNGLNNTRANLRLCNCSTNAFNSRKQRVPRTSRFKGVRWDKTRSKWAAQIKINQRAINLGRYATEDDAARAYNAAAVKLAGEFARLNQV